MVNSGADVVVSAALSQLGKPYAWDTPASATDPNPSSFDCSGLTMWCYRHAGITLPHFSGAQYLQLKHRPLSEAMPGDLVFFGAAGSIYHVALYIGSSKIVEAPDYGIPVRIRVISPDSTDIMRSVGVFPGSHSTRNGGALGFIRTPTGKRHQATYADFFADTLRAMGYPVTKANLDALATVSVIEGPNDRYNPLNSVIPEGASTAFNSSGVQDYGNYQVGLEGTVALLKGDRWKDVRQTLQTGRSESAVIGAFSSTYASWGSHPNWNQVSTAEATARLRQPIGVTNLKPIPPAPYPVASLHIPFSNTQRQRMAQYIDLINGDNYAVSHLKSLPDTDLLNLYRQVVGANIPGTPGNPIGHIGISVSGGVINGVNHVLGWTVALGKILSWLLDAHNWVRIGLFVLGAVVLIFAAWKGFAQ